MGRFKQTARKPPPYVPYRGFKDRNVVTMSPIAEQEALVLQVLHEEHMLALIMVTAGCWKCPRTGRCVSPLLICKQFRSSLTDNTAMLAAAMVKAHGRSKALVRAAAGGCIELATIILEYSEGAGALCQLLRPGRGQTFSRGKAHALVVASENGHAETVRFLLGWHKDPPAANCLDDEPLIRAVKKHRVETVRILLGAESNAARVTARKGKALAVAAAGERMEIMEALLSGSGRNAARNAGGAEALSIAVFCGIEEMIELLVEYRALPSGEALRNAILVLSFNMGKLLLEAGAPADYEDSVVLLDVLKGHCASYEDSEAVEMVQLLLSHGAYANCRDGEALMVAVSHGSEVFVRMLLEDPYAPARADCRGCQAVALAVEKGHVSLVPLLLHHITSLIKELEGGEEEGGDEGGA